MRTPMETRRWNTDRERRKMLEGRLCEGGGVMLWFRGGHVWRLVLRRAAASARPGSCAGHLQGCGDRVRTRPWPRAALHSAHALPSSSPRLPPQIAQLRSKTSPPASSPWPRPSSLTSASTPATCWVTTTVSTGRVRAGLPRGTAAKHPSTPNANVANSHESPSGVERASGAAPAIGSRAPPDPCLTPDVFFGSPGFGSTKLTLKSRARNGVVC